MLAAEVPNITVVLPAFVSLILGLSLYLWINRHPSVPHVHTSNLICWLLIALFPVMLLFAFFPDSGADGTKWGFKLSGAFAAFALIFWFGVSKTDAAQKIDALVDPLKKRIGELEAKVTAASDRGESALRKVPTPIKTCDTIVYTLRKDKRKKIALVTGNLQDVRCADVWVSSENTNMQMSRFFDRSISGTIRYLGSTRDSAGNVVEDLVASELAKAVGASVTVQPMSTFVTGSGQLAKTHNVKRILHVAAVQGQVGLGYRPIARIEGCVTRCLEVLSDANSGINDCSSVLFPLLGTGTAKGDVREIASPLIEAAITFLERSRDSSVRTVYFLTSNDLHLQSCKAVLDNSSKLLPATGTSASA
jgi:O-acetyl-ADP-ribose deacetylase (regulator of RNase III)